MASRITLIGTILAAAMFASGAAAAEGAGECELHVWPAERFQAMTTGWLSGFGVVGAVADTATHADKDKDNRSQLASALDSQGQLDALTSLDLPALMRAPPAKIVTHPEPLDRKTINKIQTRRSDSTATCYAELIVADLFYQKAAIYGRSLNALFLYRNFGSAADKPRIAKGWGGNGLSIFPPKPGDDVTAANDELVRVFKANFEEFARDAARSRAR